MPLSQRRSEQFSLWEIFEDPSPRRWNSSIKVTKLTLVKCSLLRVDTLKWDNQPSTCLEVM